MPLSIISSQEISFSENQTIPHLVAPNPGNLPFYKAGNLSILPRPQKLISKVFLTYFEDTFYKTFLFSVLLVFQFVSLVLSVCQFILSICQFCADS